MNAPEERVAATDGPAASDSTLSQCAHTVAPASLPQCARRESRRWWIKLAVQPLLILVSGIILLVSLGIAQRLGFLRAGSGKDPSHAPTGDATARYICPMMCTPPQSEPGRCPVCAMALVPAASGGETDTRSVTIDPVARRVANIHTVAVQSMAMTRTIRAIGQVSYDEGSLKTISAYVDGRLDRLYADYTGIVVEKGQPLALLYSPRLYSAQVEFLLAKKARDKSGPVPAPGEQQSRTDLYQSAKERLVLLGITQPQIDELESSGQATSHVTVCAPISGTVIEKQAVEGQYVNEGGTIYRLADLSTVWLMLRLFPEDAASVRYGQKVNAQVQSLPGRSFAGRVAFIDPNVDPVTRTVGVRVVIPNPHGLLRVGDYARASVDVPLSDRQPTKVYDAELAHKWISPRHPHVIADSPGKCPVCGVDLVPAAQFGFTDQPTEDQVLVVPRDAVLMAGEQSVVYVETEPGRFEIRRVTLGPDCGDRIVVLEGLKPGEHVATRGNFLIDSQMQLVGNPSLIDPTKADPPSAAASDWQIDLPPIEAPQLIDPDTPHVDRIRQSVQTGQPTERRADHVAESAQEVLR